MAESLIAPAVLERVLRTCTERAGSYNAYVCPEGHRTVVVLRDTGVTPSLMGCRHGHGASIGIPPARPAACLLLARTTFYREPAGGVPRWQWIRPSCEEWSQYVALWSTTKKIAEDVAGQLMEQTLEHVRDGGLVLVPLPWRPRP